MELKSGNSNPWLIGRRTGSFNFAYLSDKEDNENLIIIKTIGILK